MTEYSPAKTGEYPRIFPNFQICARCEKDLKNNNHNSLHLGRKYAWIFVLGHYLFLVAHSFPWASLSESCSLLGTDNVRGQISEQIFAPNGDYCLYTVTKATWNFAAASNFLIWQLNGHSQLWDRPDLDTSFFTLKKVQPNLESNFMLNVFLLILWYFYHIRLKTVFIALRFICKLAMKWYLLRMCAGWLCPFNDLWR